MNIKLEKIKNLYNSEYTTPISIIKALLMNILILYMKN